MDEKQSRKACFFRLVSPEYFVELQRDCHHKVAVLTGIYIPAADLNRLFSQSAKTGSVMRYWPSWASRSRRN